MLSTPGFDVQLTDLAPSAEISSRERLTAAVLALADLPEVDADLLTRMRTALDAVLACDARFAFRLAAYVQETVGRPRVAVALLVEAANRLPETRRRAGRTTFARLPPRPLVHRVVRSQVDAAYAMAWQVRHFGWAMPAALRVGLADVLQPRSVRSTCPEGPSRSAAPAPS